MHALLYVCLPRLQARKKVVQIMDRPLFDQLQAGFSGDVDHSYEIDLPNVICTEDDEDSKWLVPGRSAVARDPGGYLAPGVLC